MKIIITTPGNFSKKDISNIIAQGVLVIEAKNPSDVKIISDGDFAESEILMMSAISAIASQSTTYVNADFVKDLSRRLKEKEAANKIKPQSNP